MRKEFAEEAYRNAVGEKPDSSAESSCSSSLALDVTAEHARALHRVVRAMHDGHCPKCGHLGDASDFVVRTIKSIDVEGFADIQPNGDHKCPKCKFAITKDESERALQAFQPYLDKSLAIFEEWRS